MFSKVDECDEEGRTGLIHATLQGKENMVEVLLDGSADIEVGFLFVVVMRLCP